MQPTAPLYQTDYYAWTKTQAALLRNEDYADLDRDHLIEEIESMGASEERELENRLIVLLHHLLKLSCLPESRPREPAGRGWRLTVTEQRQQLRRHLKKNPSLRPLLPVTVLDLYDDARVLAFADLAIDNLALTDDALPVHCPWTPDQILDATFYPA